MKYIMCSRHFPKGHPKAGQPTFFVEKILNCYRDNFQLPDSFKPWIDSYAALLKGEDYLKAVAIKELKPHTIRPGSRFKPGDMVSLRVWSGAPYRSKQIEFAQVEVKRTWSIEINNRFGAASFEGVIDGKIFAQLHYGNDRDLNKDGLIKLAANDGLELEDFVDWFAIHPKKKEQVFKGQIICWSDEIDYTPDSKTIKE
jgi:hypothetical protein